MSAPTPRYIDLATLLLGAGGGNLTVKVYGAYCTAWNGTTRANTVTTGAQEFTNLPSMFPSLMAVGPVVLVQVGDSSPFLLGRVYLPDTA